MSEYTHQRWLSQQTVRTRIIGGDPAALAAIRDAVRTAYRAQDVTDDAPVYAWHGLYVKGWDAMSYQVPEETMRRYVQRPPYPADPIARMPVDEILPPPPPTPETGSEGADADAAEDTAPDAADAADAPIPGAINVEIAIDDIPPHQPSDDGDPDRNPTSDEVVPAEPPLTPAAVEKPRARWLDVEEDSPPAVAAASGTVVEDLDPEPNPLLSADHRVRPGTARADMYKISKPADGEQSGIDEVIERTRLYHEVHPSMYPRHPIVRWFSDGLYVMSGGDDPALFQAPMNRLEDLIAPREHPKVPLIAAYFKD